MADNGSLSIVIVSIILNLLVIVSISLRFLARRVQNVALGLDDYTIIPAGLLAIGIGVTNAIGVTAVAGDMGMGYHSAPERLVIYIKAQLATISMSVLALAFTKISVLSFYRRIFRTRTFVRLANILLGVNVAWGISFFLAVILACVPINASWDPLVRKTARCYSPIPAYYGIAISDTIMDVIILAAPQPIIWRLQMPKRQKVAVSGILLLGAFILGVSAARIYFFVQAGSAKGIAQDPITAGFYKASVVSRPSYWTHIECTVAVICACLPTMRVIFLEMTVEHLRSLRSYASKISMRGSPNGSKQGSVRSAPGSGKDSTELRSVPSVSGTHNYKWEATRLSDAEQPSHLRPNDNSSGIVVHKTVDQARGSADV